MIAGSLGNRRAALGDRHQFGARVVDGAQHVRQALERRPRDRAAALAHRQTERYVRLARVVADRGHLHARVARGGGVARLDGSDEGLDRIDETARGVEPDRQRDEARLPCGEVVVPLPRLHELLGRGRRVVRLKCRQRRVERVTDLVAATPHRGELVAGRGACAELCSDRAQLIGSGGPVRPAPVGGDRAVHARQPRHNGIRLVARSVERICGCGECRPGRLIAGHDPGAATPSRIAARFERARQPLQRFRRRRRPIPIRGQRRDPVLRRREIRRGGTLAEHDRQADQRHNGRQLRPSPYHARMVAVAELRVLPKAELHLHLDGSMRPETAVELAAEIGMALDLPAARLRMVGPERCDNQAALLEFFDLPISLLQTAAALRRVSVELVDALIEDGVTYAEIRWAPRLHLTAGLSVTDVIEAVSSGIAEAATRHGPRTPLVGLIVTAMRSHPPMANVELAQVAGAFGRPVIGFDLAGLEAEYPAPPHAAAFRAAREAGLSLTAHAGEVPGPQRVREALDLGARRVAHGVTAAEDPDIVTLLQARDVTLDMCPRSNVQAGIVAALAAHPIGFLHRAGVSVTLSTDDRTVSGTTLSEELAGLAAAQPLSRTELAEIAVNAYRRAFAPPNVMAPMLAAAQTAWSAWAATDEGVIG
jgi:adenosine deaminase